MDASRFDAFARVLASGTPRRDTLHLLAGAGVALAFASSAHADDENTCIHFDNVCDLADTHHKCCKGLACILGVCLDCIKVGDTGCKKGQCCGKAICEQGKCVKDENAECEGRGCKKKKKKKKH